VERFRQRVLGLENRSASDLVVEQVRGAGSSRADSQDTFPGCLQDLAQRRRRQQLSLNGGLDLQEVCAIARVEKPPRIHLRKEDRVAHQTVGVRVAAG
jgi:hypothetical protein